MIFLADRDRYTQRTLLRDIHDRLTNQAGCTDVRYRPSRRRPRYVIATIETTTFLGRSHESDRARLEIRFWNLADTVHEYYRINWIDPAQNLMFGFHRDGDHPDLGPCHVQLDYEGTTVARYEATVLDAHPLTVLETRLQQLPSALASIQWEDSTPALSEWDE